MQELEPDVWKFIVERCAPRGGDRASVAVARTKTRGRDGSGGTKKARREVACTREEKLNGRRRELPGNWKLWLPGEERHTTESLCHPPTRESSPGYETTEGPCARGRVRTLIQAFRVTREEYSNDRSIDPSRDTYPPATVLSLIFYPPFFFSKSSWNKRPRSRLSVTFRPIISSSFDVSNSPRIASW